MTTSLLLIFEVAEKGNATEYGNSSMFVSSEKVQSCSCKAAV